MTRPEEPYRAPRYWTTPMRLDDALVPAVALDRLGRLAPGWPVEAVVEPGGGQFLVVLRG